MASGSGRRALDQEIDYVRESIEKCMQMYMNKRETINFLREHINIQPTITRIVWARLERDNPKFFRAYYGRLALRDHVNEFNRLLEVQADFMRQTGMLTENANVSPSSDASHATQHISPPNAVQEIMYPENTQHAYAVNNIGPSTPAHVQGTYNESHLPLPDMPLFPNSNPVLTQSVNEMIGYGNRPDLSFTGHGNYVEPNPRMGGPYMPNVSSDNNDDAQHLEDILSSYISSEQYQNNYPTEYRNDSSSSSGMSLSNLDEFLLKYGVGEQYRPNCTPEYPIDSSNCTGNVELMEPGSSRSWRNPYFGQ